MTEEISRDAYEGVIAQRDLLRGKIAKLEEEAKLCRCPLHQGRTHALPLQTKTGRILTEDDINELAEEAERGYVVPDLVEKEPAHGKPR